MLSLLLLAIVSGSHALLRGACGSAACVALGGGGGGALLKRPWCRLSASAPPANAAPERLGARLGAAARSRPAFMAARSSAATEPLPPTLLPITFSVFAQMIGEGIAISSLPLHMTLLGASPLEVGLATSCFSVAQMVCCPALVSLSSRFGRALVLRVCLGGGSSSRQCCREDGATQRASQLQRRGKRQAEEGEEGMVMLGWSLTLSVSTYGLFAPFALGYGQSQLSATFSAGAACTILVQIALFPRLVAALGEHHRFCEHLAATSGTLPYHLCAACMLAAASIPLLLRRSEREAEEASAQAQLREGTAAEWTGKKERPSACSDSQQIRSPWLSKLLRQKMQNIDGTQAVVHLDASWRKLLAENGIKLRKGSYIKIGNLYWAPKQKRRDMTTYQKDLSTFFGDKFTDEFTNEVAALQKESMDGLKTFIKDALHVDKLTGDVSFERGVMNYVNKVTIGALGASMAFGVGAGAGVLTSTAGILAAAGGLSATGVGIVVAAPLALCAVGWGIHQQYGISEEECQTRAINYFLKGLAANKSNFQEKVCSKFDEAMGELMEKLMDFRLLSSESKELRHIIENSDQERARLEKQFTTLREELGKLDSWLCGDAELKRIVFESCGEDF
ncbi:hypothetical protein EMIHUDRAFT_471094 [Emiliania huxleyi CCMP1516]|uniref:Uncharacterized protein n=2 Tax=Emiliania huxleyi TaxID=2903 RepID=A0A0D3IAI0_EMIH1|nr:hypothetical protein EMIHUDRAFT_471094 [Emiliania huxleyi CCMP1516]EOD08265.1 hypothetical protein EMIHUDRAFT_471094 [Emiliania huxleyi CCMP1516]|eukprot:XP_005760694.1 hypothetical protein EMIHUDRAFT_471094 [Emiliania huxleyi CCMP1516]